MFSPAITEARVVFGRLAAIISLDYSFVLPSIPPYVTFGVIILLSLLLLMMFFFLRSYTKSSQVDVVAEGHEAKGWSALAEERKTVIKRIRIVLIVCLSLYLPVSQACVSIVACDSRWYKALVYFNSKKSGGKSTCQVFCQCSGVVHYVAVGHALLLLLVVTLCFPWACVQLINKNKPQDPNKR